jgi:hypothetical protein
MVWGSIKDLLLDADRPKWEVNAIIKPFQCDLLNRERLNERGRKHRGKKSLAAGRP